MVYIIIRIPHGLEEQLYSIDSIFLAFERHRSVPELGCPT